VKSDTTPPPPARTVSFELTPEVTHGGDHVADEDDDENQRLVMGDVQDFIAVGRTRRNLRKPC